MDKLRGVDSLPVVLHRFSNGVEVVKCVIDFCNEVASLERSYSESLHRLLRSSAYTFHSNLLFQWLGNDPYEEIGSLKHSWQELGQELSKLADLHSEQAESYQSSVRKPLTELLPQLEEARRNMRVKMLQLKANMELPYKKMNKERLKYINLGESCERLQSQLRSMQNTGIAAKIRLSRVEKRLDSTEKQFYEQEQIYQASHAHCLQIHRQCEEEIQKLYEKHHDREINRVNTLKAALLAFTKVLSNTVPAYLEGMQRIQFSVDKIDAASDIQWFVNEHSKLQTTPQPPQLENFDFVRDTPREDSERDHDRRSPVGKEKEEEAGAQTFDEREGDKEDLSSTADGRLDPDSAPTAPQTTNEQSRDNASGTRGSSKKWPLGGFWGGRKGRLKPGDLREEKDERREEGSDISDSSEDEKDEWEEHRITDKRRGREADDIDSPSQRGSSSYRFSSRVHTTDDWNTRSSAEGGSRVPRPAWRDEGRKTRSSARPSPNPKPASLKPGRDLGSGNDSDGVKYTCSLANPQVVGLEDELERTIQTKPRPRRTANPRVKAKQPDRQKTTDQTQPGETNEHTSPSGHHHRVLSTHAKASHTARQPTTKPPLPVRRDKLNTTPTETTASANLRKMTARLLQQAAENDYYRLFGVECNATSDDLARVRREKSRQLHPDHFAKQPERQERAQQQLMLINQVFQDVLKNIETRTLYNQLCQFRPYYGHIPDQKQHGLQVAHSKLESLYKQMKKHRAPLPILSELQTALELITACQQRQQ